MSKTRLFSIVPKSMVDIFYKCNVYLELFAKPTPTNFTLSFKNRATERLDLN